LPLLAQVVVVASEFLDVKPRAFTHDRGLYDLRADAVRDLALRVARSPKYARAAMRWLERYLDENSPTLAQFAAVTRDLAGLLE
jgi:hypothetical protein